MANKIMHHMIHGDDTFEIVDKKLRDSFVTPEMFGAKGDGVTDDTEAIQTAIDSGDTVRFSGNGKTYKVSSITVKDDTYLYGYGSKLVGNGTDPLLVVNTYSDSQVHTKLGGVIKDLILSGSDTLLKVDRALKYTFENITFMDFNTGINFMSGYENVFINMRFEGDSTNTTAVGLFVSGGGDSIFKTFVGRDVANPLKVNTGNNVFEDFHFWVLAQSLFDSSVFIDAGGNTDSLNKYIRFYFDSYKILFKQNSYSKALFDAPTILASSNVIPGESTFVYVTDSAIANQLDSALKIVNCVFKTDSGTYCNICNIKTAPIRMTYYGAIAGQYAKIAECNVFSFDDKNTPINATDVFTFSSGFSAVSGSCYKDTYNKVVFGDLVVASSTALSPNVQNTIAVPILKPVNAVNTGCFLSNSQWDTTNVAYLYISSSALVVKSKDEGMTYIKFSFNYRYA